MGAKLALAPVSPPSSTDTTASRPPASRFQEGSMNDRVSAVPPARFLGPEELAIFEKQFYPDAPPGRISHGRSPSPNRSPDPKSNPSPSRRGQRMRERPLSASAHLGQSQPLRRPLLRSHDAPKHDQRRVPAEDTELRHKKSSGFLTRVRDAIGLGRRDRPPAATQMQQGVEKRASLQPVPTQQRPARHMAKSHSQSHIPQLPASFLPNGGDPGAGAIGSDRPTREEILKSYNQLMATGFFQSHAIQSTRRPPPGRLPATQAQDQPPAERGAHLAAPTRPPPPPPVAEPVTPSRTSCSTMPDMPDSPCSPRSLRTPGHSFQMQRLAPPPRAHQKPSRESMRHQLRGRKRARPEADENVSVDDAPSVPAPVRPHAAPLSATSGSFGGIFGLSSNGMSGSASGFTRRVSKKLRKMPSGGSTISERLLGDGVLRTIRTTHSDSGRGAGLVAEQQEQSIRMRSPSPSAYGMATDRRRGEKVLIPPRVASVAGAGGANKLRKKDSPKRGPSYYPPISLDNSNNRGIQLGPAFSFTHPWRSSLSTSIDMGLDTNSARSSIESWDIGKGRGTSTREDDGAEPLSVMPDMNRGIPSVPRIPDAFKAPHVHRAPEMCTRDHENFSHSGMDVDWRFGEAL